VGRRHLTLVALVAVGAGLAAPTADAGLRWRELARDAATGRPADTPTAFVAFDRRSAARFSGRLSRAGRAALQRVDFSRDGVVAIFGEFGCMDHRVGIRAIVRRARTLVVTLVERPLAAGTMECQAIFTTYRLLGLPRAQLARPYPVLAEVRVARA
jgi:hypothetical protein